MPGRAGDAPAPAETVRPPAESGTTVDQWKGIAQPGSALATGLDAIVTADRNFDVKHFIAGARAAYEMIVTDGGDPVVGSARTARLTVRFVSHLVTVTRDRSGNVVDGNPDKVTDVTDIWTFARDLSSRDPNWKLVATEAGH